MSNILFRLKGVAIAIVALALSSSLAFAAQPPEAASFGLENAASHAGKTVPVAGGQSETTGEEEEGEEPAEVGEDDEVDEGEEVEEAGDNCLTDPTGLAEEELAAMRHGSIACWAAHQETPDGYDNHGQWVSEWAHAGKGSDAAGEAKAKGQDKANGKGKSNDKGKGNAE